MLQTLVLCLSITTILAEDLTAQEKWSNFKEQFGKSFGNSVEERARFMIFQDNLAKIEAHNEMYNQGLKSWYMGINRFTDLTSEEFKDYLTLSQPQKRAEDQTVQTVEMPLGVKIPEEINWVQKGAVTSVKDQGGCGSCWSFSTTGALEGQYFIKHGKLVSLSEQNLIDCSYNYGNMGCFGGLMDDAFQYVHDFGIMPEDSYPYTQFDGDCAFDATKSVLKVSSFVDVRVGSEAQLMYAVGTIGPVSIAINAEDFNLYAGGILDTQSCENERIYLDHGVLMVGYGIQNGSAYWLIKNSWGASWGEDGYIRIARNKNNICGLATCASYPLIE